MSAHILQTHAEMAYEQGGIARAQLLNEEALAICQRRGDPWSVSHALVNLATFTLDTDLPLSVARYRTALRHYRDLGTQAGAWACLAGLGIVAVRFGAVAEGARLLGAAGGLQEAASIPVFRMLETDYRQAVDTARATLGRHRFGRAWAEGAALTADEAHGLAMTIPLDGPEPAQPLSPFGLSPRELEVLQLMAEGRTDQEIADTLYISYRTATTHASRILNKLAVDSRTAAVGLAVRLDIA
jgi:DNA-binding CsgD family transcriptional regulator